ncbi:uncharacterized protein K452DRAFT_278799 [Aplosporella prunicola CBS 121167]|uniref:HypA-like protein n=1 Tax=Aplosporella prunicola CBS 121167 TaxID=1176127 RepID=A0A6A6B2E4_9PEZI|nr:uncharacterized protein K452DRAFT_278799 [Aplosporella prunicola CBS 121167]KAF2137187.1 hypothetical protein K452DRAFT_278799 [Aplosporella prunicola CBS 121167]
MATATKIELNGREDLIFSVTPLRKDSAEKTSQLLQEDLEIHHCFFNYKGFHNHIPHQLLTIYALGGDPRQIEKAYEANKVYQRPPVIVNDKAVPDMHDPEHFKQHLGDENYYHAYLVFFQQQIQQRGWKDVVQEFIFRGDKRANDMLVRLFAGVYHPIIYLGFGIEFSQPAIIAEGLAHTAIHEDSLKKFFLGAEEVARQKSGKSSFDQNQDASLLELFNDVRKIEKLSVSYTNKWDNGIIPEDVLSWAGDELVQIAGRYAASEDGLEYKKGEMMNLSAYFVAAAQRPPYIPKLDFFCVHSITTAIFFTSFLNASFISPSDRVRLLEWKARLDLAVYASRCAPELLLSEVQNYTPKMPSDGWPEIISRSLAIQDDGHSTKLIRALAHSAIVCKGLERRDGIDREALKKLPIVDETMWLSVAHLSIDSMEAGGPRWVGNSADGWDSVPLRKA